MTELPPGVTPINPGEALPEAQLPPGVVPIESPRSSLSEMGEEFGKAFNKGAIANTAGAPVDLANFMLGLVGLGSEEPVLGSQQIQRGMAELGFAPAVGERLGFPGIMGENIGSATGALIPFALAARAGVATTGTLSPIFNAFRNSPALFSAEEVGIGAAAGAGQVIARELFPDEPAAEMIGQLIGGFAGVPTLSLGKAATRGIRKSLKPLFPAGAKDAASERVNEIIAEFGGDPDILAAKLDEAARAGEIELLPSMITEDPGMLALEQAVVNSSAELSGDYARTVDVILAGMRRELDDLGNVPVERTKEFLEARRQYLTDLISTRNANALGLAKKRIDDLQIADPAARRTEVNKIVREEVEGSLADARGQEKGIWGRVDRTPVVGAENSAERLDTILSTRSRTTDPEDVPGYVKRFLDANPDKNGEPQNKSFLGDDATVGELLDLRSRMLEDIRRERANPAGNRRKASILSQLQEEVLNDIETLAEADDGVRVALDFSRDLNDRFTRGPVGKLLGFDRAGAQRIADELTLERTLGKGGPSGSVELDAILQAVDGSPAARTAASDFMQLQFLNQATDRNGIVVPAAASRFVDRNSQILEKFPELREQMSGAQRAQDLADRTLGRNEARRKSLYDKRQSRSALFLDGPAEGELNRVLRSKSPVANMRELVKQVKKDPTGDALEGLKTVFVEQFFARGELRAVEDIGGKASAVKFLETLRGNFTKFGEVINGSGLFSPDEAARLEALVGRAGQVEKSLNAGRQLNEIVESAPDAFVDLVARLGGARIGSQMGGNAGGSLVMAGRMSRVARSVTNVVPVRRTRELVTQAVFDPELSKVLLTRITSRNAAEIRRQLRGFLVGLQSPFGEEEASNTTNQNLPENMIMGVP